MIGLELSGVHYGALIKASWKPTNKDGSLRKNARLNEWYVMLTDGFNVTASGVRPNANANKWHKSVPPRNSRTGRYSRGHYTSNHPDDIPWYATVEVIDYDDRPINS